MDGDSYPGENDWAEGGGEGEGEVFIPYEPEEPEEALKFILSVIDELIERVIPEKPRPLTLERAGKCLRVLGKIWSLSEYPPVSFPETPNEKLMDMEGYVDEYQYLHIQAVDLGLSDVRILPQHFIWLLSADLSGNRLTNETACPVTKLPNLVALRLNRNRVEDPYLPVMKHLQYLGLNRNKIKSLHRIYHPNLETLDLNYNLVEEVNAEDCWKLTKLTQLELRGNRLATTSGIEYASLVNLYLAENQITRLEGLEVLVSLQRLHLRDNPLASLEGFSESNVNLVYLNVRNCRLETIEHVKPLTVLKRLETLVVKGNLFNPAPEKRRKRGEEEEDDEESLEDEDEDEEKEEEEEGEREEEEQEDEEMRVQILFYIPTLTRIDKKPVTKEERDTMKELADEEEV